MIDDLIYDVGMNNGDDTAYYLHRGYRVVAVEADPTLAAAAGERFREEVAAGRLTILNVAIAPEDGVLPFWICESHSPWNSFNRAIASREGSPHHRIDVRARRFRDLLAEHGVPFYLKVDIEGHDRYCFEDLDPADLPRFVSYEYCWDDDSRALLRRLAGLGYHRFKSIAQNTFTPLGRDEGPGAGRVGGWSFAAGSSGPFGPDTPGRWRSLDELRAVLDEYQAVLDGHAGGLTCDEISHSFWSDIHAARAA